MISIHKSLDHQFLQAAAELFLSALSEKFAPVIGQNNNACDFIRASINPENCFSAIENNQLVGLLAIQTQHDNFIDPDFSDLSRHFGWWGGLRKGMTLQLLQHSPIQGELYVEGVVIQESSRGQGIGSALFDKLTHYAHTQNFQKITLEVIDTNNQALKLYKRLGFAVRKQSSIWPLNKIIGWQFSKAILMEKPLKQPCSQQIE